MLIEPKRQEGMQLNVNRQMAKCKVLLKINKCKVLHTRVFAGVNGYGWFYSKNIMSKIVTVYVYTTCMPSHCVVAR